MTDPHPTRRCPRPEPPDTEQQPPDDDDYEPV
jgi:hypothetical protein